MCRVRVCVCACMAALLIFVGWFAMVCVLLVFHSCLFHISMVRTILCQGYLRASVSETTLALTMVASTLINCVAVAACVKKIRTGWKRYFSNPEILLLFVYKLNIHEVFWLKLNRINTACIVGALNECRLVAHGKEFLKTSTFHCVRAAGATVTLALFWVSVCACLSAPGKCEEEIREGWRRFSGPPLLLWCHACQRWKSKSSKTFHCLMFQEY